MAEKAKTAKTAKPKNAEKPAKQAKPAKSENSEKEVGFVMHYFPKVEVAAITLKADLAVGDTIHIKGVTSDFTQKVDSMQIEHEKITKAKKGQSVGIRLKDQARQNDKVFKAE